MDTSVRGSVLHCDDSSVDEPELQLVTFDTEESPVVDINHVLPEPDMEKFTFDDISHIDSSTLEPKMETFIVDYDEVALDVKKPSSNISLVDTSPMEVCTTMPSIVSSTKVVLKLLSDHAKYHLSFLDKLCHIVDNTYAPYELMIPVYDMLNKYAYVIGYYIDDLEAMSLSFVLACLLSVLSGFCLCTIHYMLTRFEVIFLGTPVDSEHGNKEKQGAHMRMREAGACKWKQKEKSCSLEVIERVLHHQSPVSCFMTHFEIIIH